MRKVDFMLPVIDFGDIDFFNTNQITYNHLRALFFDLILWLLKSKIGH